MGEKVNDAVIDGFFNPSHDHGPGEGLTVEKLRRARDMIMAAAERPEPDRTLRVPRWVSEEHSREEIEKAARAYGFDHVQYEEPA